ncbi:MAG: FAD-dependent oxidoreductase [Pseudomonadota bacterium]
MTKTVLVVGAGQAGAEFALAYRAKNSTDRIVLVGEEPELPYRRPPLSKLFLARQMPQAQIYLHAEATYAKQNVELRLGLRAEAIDRNARRVRFADGSSEPYDTLVLATGGRVRSLSVPGADASNVRYLRSLADAQALSALLGPGKRLVIIGGGYIGLEVAATARGLETQVTVLESMPRVLARVTAPELSAFYEKVHRDAGVVVRTDVQIDHIEHGHQGSAVVLKSGERHPADVILVGIGLIPNTELAADAGLDVDNGIRVDGHAQTSDPNILAVGDCANHHNRLLNRRLRLESVPNAMEQSRAAAATLAGTPTEYAPVPWFWSDQYKLKLQMAGLSQGHDQTVMRGDPAKQSFTVFYLSQGAVIAADTVNHPPEHQLAKRMVAERLRPDIQRLADDTQPLKDLFITNTERKA